jgi:hypothetical protein
MSHPVHESTPPIGLGVSAVTLSAIGMLLFVLPILSIPVSCAGVCVGAAGVFAGRVRIQSSVRMAVAGIILGCVSLGLGTAIALGPSGYFAPRAVFPAVERVPPRPYVPPPARPRVGD